MGSSSEFHRGTEIYRYISFQRLAEILTVEQNSLVRPCTWKDPFEKWRRKNMCESIQGNKNIDRYFAQCWTLKYKDDAMWALYSNGADGFRIKTTVGKLLKSLSDHRSSYGVAKVCYLSRKKISSCFKNNSDIKIKEHVKDFLLPEGMNIPEGRSETIKKFMIKREGFSHEEEVRLVCHCDERGDYFRYKIAPNVSEMIDQIMIHPLVNKYDVDILKSVLHKKFGFSEEKIVPSELHTM